jgi:hypothetical protein
MLYRYSSPGHRRRAPGLLFALALSSAAPAAATALDGRVVLDWSEQAFETLVAHDGYFDTLVASRALAIVHTAVHDAVNAAAPRYETYNLVPGAAGADPVAAAAAAAHDSLAALFPAQGAALDAALTRSLASVADADARARGVAVGRAAAAAMLARRADDGTARKVDFPLRDLPGAYRHVPGWEILVHPEWRDLTPFVLAAPDELRSPPPPALASAEYARAFDEVRRFGGAASDVRSADQTAYAKFWYEYSDRGWNRVARVVAAQERLDLWRTARLFALVNQAMADGYIAGWDSKLHYDLWRPVTAIPLAAEDGNPATAAVAGWSPLMPTPPIQDYPSTHSVLGAAAAEVIVGILGRDVPFAMTSPTAEDPSAPRRLAGLRAAAAENADSRVMAGIHFRFACDAGLEMGRGIAKRALESRLRPIEQVAAADR